MVNGNNIFIALDANAAPFACTRSNEIHSSSKVIEVASPNTGDWEESIAGRKSWNFTVSWLMGTIAMIDSLRNVSTRVFISVYGRTPGGQPVLLQSGYAIAQDCKITATRGNIVQGSFSFHGTGPITSHIVPVESIALAPTTLTVRVGQTVPNAFTPTVLPANASFPELEWKSSNPSRLIFNNGSIRALSPGQYTVTAKATDGSGVVGVSLVSAVQQ